jgi:hypothetical protein
VNELGTAFVHGVIGVVTTGNVFDTNGDNRVIREGAIQKDRGSQRVPVLPRKTVVKEGLDIVQRSRLVG